MNMATWQPGSTVEHNVVENLQSYIRYKDGKREFRRVHRQQREGYEHSVFDELNRAAELDYRLFWKLLRKKSGKGLTLVQSSTC